MVKVSAEYNGGLRCRVVHGPSGTVVETDAPVDNMGKGERFSPTDLVATALASCILTTMAIVAERDGHSIEGATATAEKEMTTAPRRIGTLTVKITLPASVPTAYRPKLEAISHACPVHRSLHPDVKVPVEFQYV